jgi:hypothetical protein
VTAAESAQTPTAGGPSPAQRTWLEIGAVSAFIAAAGALVAAAAGGVTEPTGIAAVVAVITTVVAYGIGPLLLTFAMRQSARSTWWAVAAALFAAGLWTAVGLVFAAPAILEAAPALLAALVTSAPSASALWLVVASVEVVRAGMQRWSLVFLSAFVAVLVIGSVFIALDGFDVRKVFVPLGWAVWMIDIGRALRSRLTPITQRPAPVIAETRCVNCGAPRRTDGLAFCSGCGLPYGSQRT